MLFETSFVSARQLVEKGKLDYLVMDYLSEITMSLLVAAQNKNPVSDDCGDSLFSF